MTGRQTEITTGCRRTTAAVTLGALENPEPGTRIVLPLSCWSPFPAHATDRAGGESGAGIVLSTLIVAPTYTSAQAAVFRPEIETDGTRTRVLVDQICAVDASRLGDFAGRLDAAETGETGARRGHSASSETDRRRLPASPEPGASGGAHGRPDRP